MEKSEICNAMKPQMNVGLDEFQTPFLATLAFPTRSPDGTADPTADNQIRSLSTSATEVLDPKGT